MAGSRLTGREPELVLLSQWVDELATGLGRAVLIEGEPGIGKSALLQAVRDESISAECAVFSAAGEELGQAFPLLPLLHAFAFQPPPSADTATAAESLLDLIDEQCAKSPTLLVVDDVHWADEATLSICRRLATSTAQRPLLLIAAMRPLPRRDDLAALRQSFGRDAVLRLEPLDKTAVAHLVANLTGGRPGPDLERLAADAGGNPLYLTELIGVLSRAGGLQVANGTVEVTGGRVPATLTDAISDRLDFLPHDVREVLQAAALLGSEFTYDDLVVVTGRKSDELIPALADAHAIGVLAQSGERWAFRHPLIRAALYEDLPAAVRVAWHRDVARALHEADSSVERIARQLLPAINDKGDAVPHMPVLDDWVIDWLMVVSPSLLDQMPLVAVELLTAATGMAGPQDVHHGPLTSRLAEGLVKLGRSEEAAKLAEGALLTVEDPAMFTALQMTLARCRADAGQFEIALGELAAALTKPDLRPDQRALLRVRAARLLAFIGSTEAAEQAAHDALSWASADADAEVTGNALLAMAANRAWHGDERGALELIDRALAAVEGRADLSDLQLMARLYRGVELIVLDEVAEAEATLRDADRIIERTANLARRDVVEAWLVSLYFETGRWDDAIGEATMAGEHMPYMRCQVEGVGALIALHRGDVAVARQHLAAAEPFAARLEGLVVGYLWLARALHQERLGALADALAILRIHDGDLQEIEVWLPAAVRLAVSVKNRDAARELAERAETLPSQEMVPHRAAAAKYCRGLVNGDAALLLEAADLYATASRPLPRAQALEEAAALSAEGGDIEAARSPFAAALRIYTKLGAEWEITRARARLRPYGLQQSVRRPVRPTVGWEALTATEAKVADLVAIGLSNREIAEQLVVSRRTVESHITKVLAKLQVRSRVDLARKAAVRPNSAGL